MTAFALFLALAAPAAERLPVPPRTDAARLKGAVDRCTAAHPAGDRCFDLQRAYAQAVLDSDPKAAAQAAEAARDAALDAVNAIGDPLDELRARGDALSPDERRRLAAGEERARRVWLDVADAAELAGDALQAGDPGNFDIAARYHGARLLREQHGRGDADRRARLRVAAKEIMVEAQSGDAAKAQTTIHALREDAERGFGPADPLTLSLVLDEADLAARLGQTDTADRLYAQARAALRSGSAERRDADARYVRHLIAADRLVAAEPLARDVLAGSIAARASAARTARAYLDVAATVEPAAAIPLADAALALRVTAFGDGHVETARARIVLARLFDRQARYAEAEPVWIKGAGVLIGLLRYSNLEVAAAMLAYGENQLLQGKLGPAASALENARATFAATLGATDARTGRAMLLLAAVGTRQGRAEAIQEMERAVEIIRAARLPTQYDRLEAEGLLAGSLFYLRGDAAGALRLFRSIGEAALDRAAAYRDFGAAAQTELRRFSGIYTAHVQAAWKVAHPR